MINKSKKLNIKYKISKFFRRYLCPYMRPLSILEKVFLIIYIILMIIILLAFVLLPHVKNFDSYFKCFMLIPFLTFLFYSLLYSCYKYNKFIKSQSKKFNFNSFLINTI